MSGNNRNQGYNIKNKDSNSIQEAAADHDNIRLCDGNNQTKCSNWDAYRQLVTSDFLPVVNNDIHVDYIQITDDNDNKSSSCYVKGNDSNYNTQVAGNHYNSLQLNDNDGPHNNYVVLKATSHALITVKNVLEHKRKISSSKFNKINVFRITVCLRTN